MRFDTAYQEVAGQLGLDYTDTNTLTRLKRWLNLAYDDIVGYYEWSWLKSREIVTMEPDYDSDDDSLTVDVAVGGTTATFSGNITVSRTNWFIQFSSADDWYKITAHTAGTNTATISSAYAQTSALSAGTFTIRKLEYSMSSNAEYIDVCKQAVDNRKVDVVHARDYDERGFPEDTGDVKKVVFWGTDSDNNWIFTPFPIPDTPMLLEFRIIKKNTALSAVDDEPIFPRRFNSIWLDIGKMYGYEFLNDDRMFALKSNANFNKRTGRLKAMADKDSPDLDHIPVIETVDAREPSDFIQFPADFERDGY